MKLTKLPDGYNSIDITPPDELLRVIDENGKSAWAYPTYFPSKTNDGKIWDGNWLVDVTYNWMDKLGIIIGWRKPL